MERKKERAGEREREKDERVRTKGRTSFFHHRRGSSHWNEKKHNLPTKHVTLLVSMGLCASASMYICAIFCRTEGEEEEERARVCFCEERCVPAAPCRDAAEGGVELAATLREDAELIVTVTGVDDTFKQSIHGRWGYTMDDLRWGHRFADVLSREGGGVILDFGRFHESHEIPPPPATD